MRNLLEESSAAQSLDGPRLDGSLLFPVSAHLGMDLAWRKCRHRTCRRRRPSNLSGLALFGFNPTIRHWNSNLLHHDCVSASSDHRIRASVSLNQGCARALGLESKLFDVRAKSFFDIIDPSPSSGGRHSALAAYAAKSTTPEES